MGRHQILVVDDEELIRGSIRRFFVKSGYEVHEAETAAAAEQLFRTSRPDAVILDYRLPDEDGVHLLKRLRAADSSVPVLILTAHGSIDLAVHAIKEGAEQFLTKPVEFQTLRIVVERLIENVRNRQSRLVRKRGEDLAPDPFLGTSPAIRRLEQQVRRVLASQSPILIQGETGSGKGLLAAWIHRNGPRAAEAIVDLNCAGLAREFLETELFGHEKGAFTGAVTNKPGLLEVAHRGTLFLDEIGDVDPQVQPKLLKVLEEKRFRKLGQVRDRQVDVRLIAASHRDLLDLAQKGRFREDLYYRISTIPLFVPPLRERPGDIPLLARMLIGRVAVEIGRPGVRLSSEAESVLEGYHWPGNVREMRNVLERAALLADEQVLTGGDLAESLAPAPRPAHKNSAGESLLGAERRHIELTLRDREWDILETAAVLGLSRSALYKKLKKHGINPKAPAR